MLFRFGTKAQTLDRLKPYLKTALVTDLYYFEVGQWCRSSHQILQAIEDKFGKTFLAIRSSTLVEDGGSHSMAGAFTSCLNVDGTCKDELVTAIESVIASYRGNPYDQVLIQPMIKNVAVSGVITTHVLDDGGPYYVLNYDDESGKTDTVTGGTGVNKTVLIHRSADPSLIESERVARWLEMTKELERICGNIPLDIEFAQCKSGQLFLLQVRRIAVDKNWNRSISQRIAQRQQYIEKFIAERSRPKPDLAGSRTILGEMPDWNPAEIIGTSPRPLAVSLYRWLVTDEIWREARAKMGYRHPLNELLMVIIGGRPYIDVRNSFNSFLPSGLDEKMASMLVDAWLDYLDSHPEWHDKVEFMVAHTALDFNFDQNFHERYANILTSEQARRFKAHLRHLTRSCLDMSHQGTLNQALQDIARLEDLQTQRDNSTLRLEMSMDILVQIRNLLAECKELGTLPFSIIARHAFIAEALLRSAVQRGALTSERLAAFKSSLVTVMGSMSEDLKRVCDGFSDQNSFLKKYGHLRPGTYDILSRRYDQRDDLFVQCVLPEQGKSGQEFRLTLDEFNSLEGLLTEAKLDEIRPNHLLAYAKKAIIGREFSKFVFSKNLSDALELIARWGEQIGLTRDDLSYIPISGLLDVMNNPVLEDEERYFRALAEEGRKAIEMTRALRLGYLIRDIRDIYVIPLHRSAPNFVTNVRLEGQIVFIDSRMSVSPNLFGMIVCIENADPGFDWIFTRGIAGLITKFGGSNSHMAIRCAEFALPAAIGCGEQTFERLVAAGKVELNCADKIVRALYG